MKRETIMFWKVHRDPVWGTYVTKARMTRESAEKRYAGLKVEPIQGSELVLEVPEDEEESQAICALRTTGPMTDAHAGWLKSLLKPLRD